MIGYFKKFVIGVVCIDWLGLLGDMICDMKYYGGVDQVVYIFGDLDWIWWVEWLDCDVFVGFFGENLFLFDLISVVLCFGDVLVIGDVWL